jgi:serine/threonine protein kinase
MMPGYTPHIPDAALPKVLEVAIEGGEGGIRVYFEAGEPLRPSIRLGDVQRDGPAYGKVQRGDLVTYVNGKTVAEIGVTAARQLMESAGSVTLKVERPSFASKYKLGSVVGKGAFSKVHSCQRREKKDAPSSAVKVIDNHGMSEKHLLAMEREIAALKKASHPNVLQLHSDFREGDVTHLVTELLSGGSVLDWMVTQYPPPTDAILHRLTNELASALQHCHELGIVHRDIKPDNIVMNSAASDAPLKLVDFGMCQVLSKGQTLVQYCGTPDFMAPEVLENKVIEMRDRRTGDSEYSIGADMWSFGVTVYILCTGFHPFPFRHQDGQAMRTSECWGMISGGLVEQTHFDKSRVRHLRGFSDLIWKTVCLNPAQRWSAAQVLSHPFVQLHKSRFIGDIPKPVPSRVMANLKNFAKYKEAECYIDDVGEVGEQEEEEWRVQQAEEAAAKAKENETTKAEEAAKVVASPLKKTMSGDLQVFNATATTEANAGCKCLIQ